VVIFVQASTKNETCLGWLTVHNIFFPTKFNTEIEEGFLFICIRFIAIIFVILASPTALRFFSMSSHSLIRLLISRPCHDLLNIMGRHTTCWKVPL